MDAEDIKRQVDKIDLDQRGKKVDVDQEEVKRKVDSLVAAAKTGDKQQAIDSLLAIEKQCRVAEDPASARLVCTAVLQVRKNMEKYPCLQMNDDDSNLNWHGNEAYGDAQPEQISKANAIRDR